MPVLQELLAARRRRPGRGRRPDRAAARPARRSCSCRSRSGTPGRSSSSEISRYDERGPAWYWNNISTGEHTGTHFDAPVHWVTGQDGEDVVPGAGRGGWSRRPPCSTSPRRPPPTRTSCSRSSTSGPGRPSTARCRPAAGCSTAPAGTAARDDQAEFLNADETGPHTPGISVECARWLAEEAPVHRRRGGDGRHRRRRRALLRPAVPLPLVPARRRQVRPDPAAEPRALPPTGAVLIAAPLPIVGGSGSPARVLALVER